MSNCDKWVNCVCSNNITDELITLPICRSICWVPLLQDPNVRSYGEEPTLDFEEEPDNFAYYDMLSFQK